MQRTDRLFEIIEILRGARRPLQAAAIAERLEVSPRTVYRYIATLQSMRIPIEGAAGIGYVMRPGYDLPPLNFAEEELEAIVVGLGLLARTGDRELQRAARRVLGKIESHRIPADSLRVSDWGIAGSESARLGELRTAIREERKLHIAYRAVDGAATERTVLPIVLTYHVEVAVLAAWCTLRRAFRSFRVDRIATLETLEERFTGEGETLRRRLMEAEAAG